MMFVGLGCSSTSTNAPTDTEPSDTGPETPAEWDRNVVAPSDEEAATARKGCKYAAGALPKETQGSSHPMGAAIPIDTILVIMMENRSFDHYFQGLGRADIEVAPAGFTNPDKDGKPVAPHEDTLYCFLDTAHGWKKSHDQWNGGKNDGFVVTNEQTDKSLPPHGTIDMLSGARAMAYYSPAALPLMAYLADEWSIGDHYHASVMGPTWPNRMYLYAATSFGRATNAFPDVKVERTLFDYLELRGVRWKIYAPTTPSAAILPVALLKYREEHLASGDDFFADAAAGRLPGVAFVDPRLDTNHLTDDSEHPPAIMQRGQTWIAQVIAAIGKSPQWSRSALFLTYDEHGGLFDHVPPPSACPPDALEPILEAGDPPGRFDRLGFRVPFAVVSPYARKRFVGHHVYDHTTIVRFIEARFTIPALTARDANAEAPWEMFDFTAPARAVGTLPSVTIDPDKAAACKTIYTP